MRGVRAVPFSRDHGAIGRTLGAWRAGNNPDGRRPAPGQQLEMAADIFARMMRGEISAYQAQAEWAKREPGQRAFNARLRAQALGGLVGDSERLLDPEADVGAVRDQQTGEFASVEEAVRDAQATPLPGGMVPQETPAAPADPIRQAYWRAVDARAEHDRQGNDR